MPMLPVRQDFFYSNEGYQFGVAFIEKFQINAENSERLICTSCNRELFTIK